MTLAELIAAKKAAGLNKTETSGSGGGGGGPPAQQSLQVPQLPDRLLRRVGDDDVHQPPDVGGGGLHLHYLAKCN